MNQIQLILNTAKLLGYRMEKGNYYGRFYTPSGLYVFGSTFNRGCDDRDSILALVRDMEERYGVNFTLE